MFFVDFSREKSVYTAIVCTNTILFTYNIYNTNVNNYRHCGRIFWFVDRQSEHAHHDAGRR